MKAGPQHGHQVAAGGQQQDSEPARGNQDVSAGGGKREKMVD
jgi:hypothetical protein